LVNGDQWGNETVGTIDQGGNYEAPRKSPRPSEICIQAQVSGKSPSFALATVLIGRKPRYSYVGSWNKKGERGTEGPGELRQSHGICLEPSGNLLICDSFLSRVYRYTPQGDYLGEIGLGPGREPGALGGPRNIQVGEDGEIFVADGNLNRIQVFAPSGEFLRGWGRRGSGSQELKRPHALALGRDGTVVVADVDNHRVIVYDRHGRHLRHWGRRGNDKGEFHAPHGLVIDPNGDIFVTEYHGRCQKFTPEGEFLYAFANQSVEGEKSHGDYLYHDMTSDRWGNVYLMARNTRQHRENSVDKYNNSGELITRFALPPQLARSLGAEGAAIDHNGRMFVADTKDDFAGVSIFDPE
jgi:hypothetical protein